jgi:hypothetical protein
MDDYVNAGGVGKSIGDCRQYGLEVGCGGDVNRMRGGLGGLGGLRRGEVRHKKQAEEK